MLQSNQGRLQLVFTPDPSDRTSANVDWKFFTGSSEPVYQCTSRFTLPEEIPSKDQTLMASLQKKIGELLFVALFGNQSGPMIMLDRARAYSSETETPLFLDFYFTLNSEQFAQLPWEMMRDPKLSHDLLLWPGNMVGNCVRNLDLPVSTRIIKRIQLPLHILIVEPESTRSGKKRFIEEMKSFSNWSSLEDFGLIKIEEVMPPVTPEKLEDITRESKTHILQFIGEGGFDGEGGFVVLDETEKQSISIRFDRFQVLFGNTHTAILFAKNTTQSGGNLLSSVVTALSAAGVPYVLGMQFNIDRNIIVQSSRAFYEAIARGETHEQALGRLRRYLYINDNQGKQWYIPTLFARRAPGHVEEPLIGLHKAYEILCDVEKKLAEIGAGSLLAAVRAQKQQLEQVIR